MALEITITSSANKKVAKVHFKNPTAEEDFSYVSVAIRNVVDVRIDKPIPDGAQYERVKIVTPVETYKLHFSAVKSVDGVDPLSNQQLYEELEKMQIAAWD